MSKGFGDDLFDVFDQEPDDIQLSDNISSAKRKSDEQDDDAIEIKKTKSIFDSIDEIKDDYKLTNAPIEELNLSKKDLSKEIAQSFHVNQIYRTEDCNHEVVIPGDSNFDSLVSNSDKPAKEYKFTLDTFQRQAIMCLENSQSVLVSAHTSAGKTVVAEYAIAMSFKKKQKVIYTTPIKALSNQKFREFQEEFQDVGLMTGDTTINPSASCIIMTTEILRSMLYRGSELTREVAWVVFDEIHYMRDKMRGVVWEETIILLPDNVRYVFLSATIPNAQQFAEWIVFLHKQPVHVVYTEKRPVPLQHYIYPAGGDGVHLILDEKGEFKEKNLAVAMDKLTNAGDAGLGDQRGRRGGTKGRNESNVLKVVRMITEKSFTPVIIFSFSRKECEEYAVQLAKLDFNTDVEKEHVEKIFNNAMLYLNDDDRKLPQVEHVLPLLKKGIGIHHSGLLPLLKETIEILFGEGLIKTLFATETFAMGLNMPAKTVLFTQTQKFDGVDMRTLTSGEYIQMSGRAGRRGLDDKGIVIMMVNQKMTANSTRVMLKGDADPLNSAFHLTYNMVLNLMRVEEVNPEYMLERSFYQFQNYTTLPILEKKIKEMEKKFNSFKIPKESEIETYHKLRRQLKQKEQELLIYIQKPKYIVPMLKVGRLIKVKHEDLSFGWGAVINVYQKTIKDNDLEKQYIVDVILSLDPDCVKNLKQGSEQAKPAKDNKGEMTVIPITLKTIEGISSFRIPIPDDLKSRDKRQSIQNVLIEIHRRHKDGLPLLDPLEDLGIKEDGFKEVIKKIETLERRLNSHSLCKDVQLEELYNIFESKVAIGEELKKLKQQLKAKKSLLQMEELKCRKRVLRRLGYATSQDVIEIKGRVACEIDSVDELLVTELLFNGMFNDLSSSEIAAVMSCFVFEEKGTEMPKLTDTLSATLRQIQETARRIAKVCIEAKIELDEEEYVEKLKPFMMDIVYAWCEGASFSSICKMTDIFEGSIVRSMRRLAEVMRQLVCAAKAIGNTNLENKFSEAIRLMKRDIIFAASLYL